MLQQLAAFLLPHRLLFSRLIVCACILPLSRGFGSNVYAKIANSDSDSKLGTKCSDILFTNVLFNRHSTKVLTVFAHLKLLPVSKVRMKKAALI